MIRQRGIRSAVPLYRGVTRGLLHIDDTAGAARWRQARAHDAREHRLTVAARVLLRRSHGGSSYAPIQAAAAQRTGRLRHH